MATGQSAEGADIPEDLTMCPICFEVFKSPKSLPCLHTFCKACLQTYISQASQKNRTEACCPVCRASVDLSNVKAIDGWVEGLPTNFVVNSLIEHRQLESGVRKCDACQHHGIDIKATSWCKECSEALCENCAKVHRAFKMARHHTLGTITEAKHVYVESEEALDCPLHKNRKMELFCYDHEIPCCLTCMTVHHRKCDKVTTLEEAAENFRDSSEISDILKRLECMVTDFNQEVENHETMEHEIKTQICDAREEIRKNKDSMMKHIEILHKTLDDEVSALEKNQDVDDEKATLLQHKVQLVLYVKTLDTMRSKSSNVALFLEYYKLKAKEKNHADFFEEHRAKCEKKTVEFVMNDEIKTFQTLISSIGKIRVSSSPCHTQAPVGVDYTTCAVKEVLTIQENGTRFTDAVFLGSDVIVAVDDSQNTLWGYNSQGIRMTSLKLSSNPWALTAISDKEVVVSLCGIQRLQFFIYEASKTRFSSSNSVTLQDTPFAVDYTDGYLFVTFSYKVKKMKLDGTVVMEISISESFFLYGIAQSGDDVVTAEHSENESITKFGPYKNVVFKQSFTDLSWPVGLTIDRNSNLYVVGYISHNVVQLSPDGTLIREIVSASSGYVDPMGINFSRTENKLLLTHTDKITVLEFIYS